MVVVDQRLIVQYCSERHIKRAALAGIAVHLAAFSGLKMTHSAAAADDLPVFCDLYSLCDALGRHNISVNPSAQ
jgi:hypothetical protein